MEKLMVVNNHNKNDIERELLKVVFVGHVDHGKSTLIGRLLYETKRLPEAKINEIKNIAQRQGEDIEFANVLDALEEEQKQNITIDTTQLFFKTQKRDYAIIDAPGHKEFLKNMITGAANANVAILLIDANEGVREQTKRHAYLLSLLGINEVIVVVNKMDKISFNEEIFKEISKKISSFLQLLNIKPKNIIPLSAKFGENLSSTNTKMPWYQEGSFLENLEEISINSRDSSEGLRFPVQDVYKNDGKRRIVGRIESGTLNVGDNIIFSPSLKEAKVKSIEKWNQSLHFASVGESIGITTEEELFIERGEIISGNNKLPNISSLFCANVFWMGKEPLIPKKKYLLKLATEEVEFEITSISKRLNSSTLEHLNDRSAIFNTEAGEISIKTKKQIAHDLFNKYPKTGRFVIVDNYDVCGGGTIIYSFESNI